MSLKTVFLSSTARDLAEYRETVYRAIEGLDGCHCVRMEDFGARDWEADSFCQEKVAECDLFVGVLGHLYGSSPKGCEQSYTEREHNAAVEASIPRLTFIAPEDFPLPAHLIEPDEKRRKQQDFRELASWERIRDTFTTPENLAWRVVRAIHNWRQESAKAELHQLLWPGASDVAATRGFRDRRHDELLRVLQTVVDQRLGENVRVSVFQSLADAGCDIAIVFPAQGFKYGIQLKSHGDISQADFATKTLAQIQDSRRHGLNRLHLMLAGDLTDVSQREKVQGLTSRISQMQDDYVVVVPPERAWTLLCEPTPGIAAEPKDFQIPLPPQPYFVHPYPLQEHFTGRVHERQMLTEWLTGDHRPILELVASGGMGKSALAWAWLQRDVLGLPLPGPTRDLLEIAKFCRAPRGARPEGVLWWSFYEQAASFDTFLDGALIYASIGSVDPAAIPSAHEKIEALVDLLREHRLLLVLDGFERQLRAYANLSAAHQGDAVAEDAEGDFRACIDPHAADFLRCVAAGPLPSRVLLTSRLFPRELESLAGCRWENLAALDPEDAVTFFHVQGVRGTRAEIQAACEPYGYLPLALRLLTGVIVRDKRRPGDVRVARRYPVVPELKGKEQHHILQVAYEVLGPSQRELLSRLAAFRSPVEYEAAKVVSPFENEGELKAALQKLVEQGLLFFDRERGHYDLHPVVRRYGYDRLADKAGTHTRLRDYFAAVPPPERVENLDDLAPVIELYHHTVRAGQYDEAVRLLRDRLVPNPLYYRFGAYGLIIELLRALFPGGEPLATSGEAALPMLSDEGAQAWTLNALANSYSLSGQPGRAVPLFEASNAIDEKRGSKKGVAIGLGNVADDQLKIGALAAAEENLRREIALCREIEDEFNEAIGHREVGRLLAYTGAFEEAGRELATSTAYWERTGDKQGICLDESYRALRALLVGDADVALAAARRAQELADIYHPGYGKVEADIIRAEWLLGAAHRARGELAQAEEHLGEALRRCRRINLIHFEPDILLELARVRAQRAAPPRAVPLREESLSLAQEALEIADRCGYRLAQADCHSLLAQLALEEGNLEKARRHAETARQCAQCDGPPHRYEVAFREAERLLQEIKPAN